MNRGEALSRARELLAAANIPEAALEAEVLLRHILKLNRAQLYAELPMALTADDEQRYFKLINRRVPGEPTAYITGHKEFYGRDFYIDHHVLIPRPETELLVEKTIELARPFRAPTIADVGTGSGILAITLALELPDAHIYATDISTGALKVARRNCEKHGVTYRVTLLEGDLLKPISRPVDLIVANLPYVRTSELPPTGEPRLALDGGTDGLDCINKLVSQIPDKLNSGGCLLLEIGMGQAEAAVVLLEKAFPKAKTSVYKDLAGIERVVAACT